MASSSLIPLYIGIDTPGDVFGSIIFKSYTMCTPLVLFAEIDRASYITLLTPWSFMSSVVNTLIPVYFKLSFSFSSDLRSPTIHVFISL